MTDDIEVVNMKKYVVMTVIVWGLFQNAYGRDLVFNMIGDTNGSKLFVVLDEHSSGPIFDSASTLLKELIAKSQSPNASDFAEFAKANIMFDNLSLSEKDVIEEYRQNYSRTNSINLKNILLVDGKAHLNLEVDLKSGRSFSIREDAVCTKEGGCKLYAGVISQFIERLLFNFKQASQNNEFIDSVPGIPLANLGASSSIYLEEHTDKDKTLMDNFLAAYKADYLKAIKVYEAPDEEGFNSVLLEEFDIERRRKGDRFLRVSWKNGSPIVAVADFMVYGTIFRELTEQPKIHDYFIENKTVYFVVSAPGDIDTFLFAYDLTDSKIINAYGDQRFQDLNSAEVLKAFRGHYGP